MIAVLTWNAAIRLIGPQNAVLFGNLIPVTTFAIVIVRGYRPGAVELGGAALTILALVASNLLVRRSARAPVRARAVEREGAGQSGVRRQAASAGAGGSGRRGRSSRSLRLGAFRIEGFSVPSTQSNSMNTA